jgi:2'-5' RNA ligase
MPNIFIASFPNKKSLEELDLIQNKLRKFGWSQKYRWVELHKIHLTLLFLGKYRKDNLPQPLPNIYQTKGGLFIKPLSLQTFSRFSLPHLLLLKIKPHRELKSSARKLRRDFRLYILKKRPPSFIPHITLARLKSQQSLSPLEIETQSLHLSKQKLPDSFHFEEIAVYYASQRKNRYLKYRV